MKPERCQWVTEEPLYIAYHDQEWGVPVFDERLLFEFLLLEGMQAGLSWWIVLQKREALRKAYADFNPEKIARFTPAKQQQLLANPKIIRNRLKVRACISNAQAYLEMREQGICFVTFLWQCVDGQPKINRWRRLSDIPSHTTESELMSKRLKQQKFKFVGPTICYAFMQAVGMVNDHLTSCFRYHQV